MATSTNTSGHLDQMTNHRAQNKSCDSMTLTVQSTSLPGHRRCRHHQQGQQQQQHFRRHYHHHHQQRDHQRHHQHKRQQHRSSSDRVRQMFNNLTSPVVLVFLLSSLLHTVSSMHFTVQPTNQSVAQGHTIVLRCTIASLVGNVQWMQGGFGLGFDRALESFERYSIIGVESRGEYNLQIQEVKVEDEGRYECQVTASEEYPKGLRSQPAQLSVVVAPQRPTITNGPRIPVTLHVPTDIQCRADGGKPAAKITWHLNGERLLHGVTTREEVRGSYYDTISTLSFNATLADNGQEIKCMASTDYTEDKISSTSSTLDVMYPPTLEMQINVTSGSIRETDTVRVHCIAKANPAHIVWSWYREGHPIPGNTDTLVIPAVTYDWHKNQISCVANNSVGSSRRDQILEVKFGAQIENITQIVGADLGARAILRCDVKGNPPPKIVWKRAARVGSPVQHTLSTSSVYVIDQVREDSFGTYLCMASVEGFAVKSYEAQLTKNKPPQMLSKKQQFAVIDESAQLECRTNSVPKPTSFTWTRNNKEVQHAMSSRLSVEKKELPFGHWKFVLQFQKVQASDFGLYNCTVINDYGEMVDQIELVEKYVLPITYIIIGIIAGIAFIFLVVLIFVLYRRHKKDDQGSVLDAPPAGSYTDTESSSDKKREKADSPTTLMGQLRQDYNKDMYRFSADYDDMPYKEHNKGNNNGYGVIGSYETYSDQQVYDGEYVPVHRGEDLLPDRYDSVFNSGQGYSFSSFSRGNNYDTSTPPPTMTRLTPMHMSDSKLATDV